jgi:hypothetical protein
VGGEGGENAPWISANPIPPDEAETLVTVIFSEEVVTVRVRLRNKAVLPSFGRALLLTAVEPSEKAIETPVTCTSERTLGEEKRKKDEEGKGEKYEPGRRG